MKAHANHQSPRRRRGISLVELMVMMTAVAAMLGVCVMLLGLAMRLESDGRSGFERAETIARLSGRFRRDVHEARNASLDGRVLKLETSTGRAVEYRVDERGELTRFVLVDGQVTAHEAYRISGNPGARLALKDGEGRRFAILTLEVQPRRDRVDPIRSVQVEAFVGKSTTPKIEGDKP